MAAASEGRLYEDGSVVVIDGRLYPKPYEDATAIVIDAEAQEGLRAVIMDAIRRCCAGSKRKMVLLVGMINTRELFEYGACTVCTVERFGGLCVLDGHYSVEGVCCDSRMYGSCSYDPLFKKFTPATDSEVRDWEILEQNMRIEKKWEQRQEKQEQKRRADAEGPFSALLGGATASKGPFGVSHYGATDRADRVAAASKGPFSASHYGATDRADRVAAASKGPFGASHYGADEADSASAVSSVITEWQ